MAEADIPAFAPALAQKSVKRGARNDMDIMLLKTMLRNALIAVGAGFAVSTVQAQIAPMERLTGGGLEVHSPDQRVSGTPGQMRIETSSCSAQNGPDLRKRIVDIAVQEWAFFGFSVVDQTGPQEPFRSRSGPRRPWMDPNEAQRVAASIAGYWSVTPDGGWILERQNDFWKGPLGVGERWRDPWSAAFISWTLCEAGINESTQFRRSINHRTYIDQAIRSRDANSTETAYVAYDVGERAIEPGDLLCTARRHGYRSLDDRRRHLGEGARSHCDIVVHVDSDRNRILGIGGNVRGRVSLKLIDAVRDIAEPGLHTAVGRDSRAAFAHLKFAAPASNDIGLVYSPSVQEISSDPLQRAALEALLGMELPPLDES